MDMVKIGKFIAQCRKEKNLTQAQLAEKFGITDRAFPSGRREIPCRMLL
ncbi:MAG: helix-turn-helix transcriptional regulator [Treponema sp.]|nr:helix-turn-helix transcriptional regulator [Treponema sp.]